MTQISYRPLAEKWLKHILEQYDETTFICKRDLPLIEHCLRAGLTLVAVRSRTKVLHVDFLGDCSR